MPAVSSGSDGGGLSAVLQDGFRVRYLGSMGFTGPRRIASAGMRAVQRPLLTLYSAARRRSENYRSDHPMSLTQFLDVSEYGLVVVDIEEEDDGDFVPVITKVITPITNLMLWAAVRFHTRPNKKKSLGAAFVPVACSDGVLDKDSFVHLGSKQRFLAGLSHPPLFVCLLQRVDAPKSLECHAFVCASAEDSLAICSVVAGAKDGGRTIGSLGYYCKASSTTYRSTTDMSRSEEDCLSTLTPSTSTLTEISSRTPKKTRVKSPVSLRSESCPRPVDWNRENSPVLGRRFVASLERCDDDLRKTPRLSKRYIHNGYDNEGYDMNVRARRVPSPEIVSDEPQYGHVGFSNLDVRQRVSQNEDDVPRWSSSLPRYNHGRNDKPSKTGVMDKTVGLSRSSSDATLTSNTKETVTVIQTVDFSSENESAQSSVFNGHADDKHRRYKSVGCSTRSDIVPPHKPLKDMSTMTDSSVAWTTTEQSSDPEESDPSPKRYIKGPNSSELNHPRRKQMVSVELSKSLDFDTESEYSQIVTGKKYSQDIQKIDRNVYNNERVLDNGAPIRPMRKAHVGHVHSEDSLPRSEYRRPQKYEPRLYAKSSSYDDILGNGTNKVTINVPYHKPPSSESSYAPSKASCLSQGVKGFHRRGQVKNWSTMSLASDRSYQNPTTLPKNSRNNNNKVIRWSSVEDVPRKRGVLSSIKNFSVKSLTRAKNKTGQLLNSLKRKVKDKPEQYYHNPYHHRQMGSETDSAYDNSEVCLSPDGALQRNGIRQHRRESWSFHDLREEFLDSPNTETKNSKNRIASPGLSSEASAGEKPVRPTKKRSKGHRSKHRSSQDSSDSGLEESDYSGKLNRSRMQQNGNGLYSSEVSLISVNGHSHRPKDYRRYSKSNLQKELGYMP